MKNNQMGLALIVAVLAGQGIISGCKPSTTEPTKEATPAVAVQVVSPRRGPITRTITLPAETKAYQQATLYAKVAGYLKKITVDKGDRVKEGDLIADIEVPELVADLARYKAEAEVAELDYKRLSESQKKFPDLVVPQTVDNAKGKLDVAKASLDRTETLLGFAKITAPFSGIITRRMVDPGAFIPAATSGSAAQNAAIVTLTDFNRVRIQVAVPELEASLVRTDQPVKVTVDGLPGRSFDGNVTRFSYTLDEASKTMLAEIELPNSKLELRPGMFATVKLTVEHKANALLIPADALVVEKARTSVFTLVDGKAKKVPVKVGFEDGKSVEILDGVTANSTLILIGNRVLTDGQPVQVMEGK